MGLQPTAGQNYFSQFSVETVPQQPFISLLSKRSSSHLALTLSPRILYLIHLMSPCILLTQISSLTSKFSSPECTCKQSISSCKNIHTLAHTHTQQQTLLDNSIILLGIDWLAVSRKGEKIEIRAEGRKQPGGVHHGSRQCLRLQSLRCFTPERCRTFVKIKRERGIKQGGGAADLPQRAACRKRVRKLIYFLRHT